MFFSCCLGLFCRSLFLYVFIVYLSFVFLLLCCLIWPIKNNNDSIDYSKASAGAATKGRYTLPVFTECEHDTREHGPYRRAVLVTRVIASVLHVENNMTLLTVAPADLDGRPAEHRWRLCSTPQSLADAHY